MKILLLSSCLSLTNCASIPNFPACVEVNIAKAFCVKVLTNETFYISETEKYPVKLKDGTIVKMSYFEMRPLMVVLPPDSYASIKKYLIKNCHNNKQCSKIGTWDRSIESIDSKMGDKDVP